jgi:hypothetical protein
MVHFETIFLFHAKLSQDYSPELASYAFFLFDTIKKNFSGHRFDSLDDRVVAVIRLSVSINLKRCAISTVEDAQCCSEPPETRVLCHLPVRQPYSIISAVEEFAEST